MVLKIMIPIHAQKLDPKLDLEPQQENILNQKLIRTKAYIENKFSTQIKIIYQNKYKIVKHRNGLQARVEKIPRTSI